MTYVINESICSNCGNPKSDGSCQCQKTATAENHDVGLPQPTMESIFEPPELIDEQQAIELITNESPIL